jgi:hypothetical protein
MLKNQASVQNSHALALKTRLFFQEQITFYAFIDYHLSYFLAVQP